MGEFEQFQADVEAYRQKVLSAYATLQSASDELDALCERAIQVAANTGKADFFWANKLFLGQIPREDLNALGLTGRDSVRLIVKGKAFDTVWSEL